MFKALLSFFLITISYSYGKISFSGNNYKKIYEYEKVHKKFSKQVCTPGIDFKYYKLLSDYRGDGLYLPMLNEKVDRKAIKSNLFLFSKKIKFIKKNLRKLKKEKKYSSSLSDLMAIENNMELYLRASEKGVFDTRFILAIKVGFNALMEKNYFLKSFMFPNDHEQNRKKYDGLIKYSSYAKKQQSNKLYFYRKIVEDGTLNKENKRSDLYLRSTLDTLATRLNRSKIIFDDNLRYDLEWVVSKIKLVHKKGQQEQIERLEYWLKLTQKKQKAYKKILGLSYKSERKILKDKFLKTKNLKKFVYDKQAEAFRFWKKQDPILKVLFVMETALFNEVGTVDGKDALERKDVAKLILNRFLDKEVNQIERKQELTKYLETKEWQKENILGTLFKRGEFSFTYYYISSVVKIFCPDMTRYGRSIRKKNLKISLSAIQQYKYDFYPSRYFSRVSMLGKIDMGNIWSGYESYPQRPGLKAYNQRSLNSLYKKKKYLYLYTFVSTDSKAYKVVRINNKTYSVLDDKKKLVFHKYRDPNLFTYFSKK